MKTATRIHGKVEGRGTGEMRLYHLDPPMTAEDIDGPVEYAVVSATIAFFTGAETYIFPADADGNITDWVELEGSYRGGLDHDAALANCGYIVTDSVTA